jgi:hypothetical protein
MRRGQTLKDNNVEVALFPLEYMNISQGEYGSYSHMGTLSMDFLGWDSSGRVLRCPYYAPVSSRVVYHGSYYNVWQSLDEVITPLGKRYITYVVMHDDNPPILGTIKNQGELIGHTGTNAGQSSTPLTGDHVHINTANGIYAGWETVSSGKQQLVNSSHIYDTFFINDTVIINGNGYSWKTYSNIPQNKKYKFKWVLYTNKIRNNF